MRLLVFLCLGGCGGTTHLDAANAETLASALQGGELSLLTYNVAGLPEPLSHSRPQRDSALISPLLNAYDVVVVQEDFWYHQALIQQDSHPYVSAPYRDRPHIDDIGDGLNQLSLFPFSDYVRLAWTECNGTIACENDCLARKGFTFSVLTLATGVDLHLYNLHLDAGDCAADMRVRGAQIEQLSLAITTRSEHAPLIVAGDTNLWTSIADDMKSLNRLLARTGLRDVCRTVACGPESIDRVMFRSGDTVSLTPLSLRHPGEFVDAAGVPLSDHLPVEARIRWSR